MKLSFGYSWRHVVGLVAIALGFSSVAMGEDASQVAARTYRARVDLVRHVPGLAGGGGK